MQHHSRFRPPAVQGLIGLVTLVAVQRLTLVALDQGRVHVQRRRALTTPTVQKPHKRIVHPPQGPQRRRRRRNERRPRNPPGLFPGVVKAPKPGQHRRRRRHRATTRPAPAQPHLPALPAAQNRPLRQAKHRREPAVPLQTLKIIDAVAAGKVQNQRRHQHLNIQPALRPANSHLPLDRFAQTASLQQLKIKRQTAKSRHTRARTIRFVLDRQNALCHHQSPRWSWFRSVNQNPTT